MTLSRWIRDYIFTPLTFASRGSRWLPHVWLIVAMAACGLWHGAAWTFVLWGIWHGVLLVIQQVVPVRLPREKALGWGGRLVNLGASMLTLAGIVFGWLLFRARTLHQVADMILAVASLRGGVKASILRENGLLVIAAIWVGLLAWQALSTQGRPGQVTRGDGWKSAIAALRGSGYALMVALVITFDTEATTFVYFQF
jgi:alginate O-acetyltransferase complex protein AlgI